MTKPPIILEPRRDTDLRRLAQLLAMLAWKRAQAVQSSDRAA
jgi:hypothetical protein